jgi:hypothetical protein
VLVAFGNWIDRGPYFMIDGSRHYTNLFAAMSGLSAISRKGTSEGRVKQLFGIACDRISDPWMGRMTGGLASGEGLIVKVRDQDDEEQDDDKRLMIMEPEFVRVLSVIERSGNTLPAIMQQAWDSGNISTMTVNPVQATGAHISLLTHITIDQLRRRLSAELMSSGFANRIMWTAVRSTKDLPEGGGQIDLDLLARKLVEARRFAENVGEMKRTDDARELWAEKYGRLKRGLPGVLSHMTVRGAPIVVRLSMIYALLDKSKVVDEVHLRAALEVWRYCRDSVVYIFGNATGDPIADRIYGELLSRHPGGMTRTQMHKAFAGHGKAAEIDTALATLKANRLAHDTPMPTGGRPAELWTANKR